MQAAEMLTHLSGMGISLTPRPGGKIEARPKSALTDEARRLICGHKSELLAALQDEARIRAWLQSIGEDDPQVIAEILERARTDPEARADYLRRAAEAARPAWWERVLGNEAKSIATLEPEERAEAARLGLLPAKIAEAADLVVVAYRNGGAQGLMTIPAERYDGLRVLEIFAE